MADNTDLLDGIAQHLHDRGIVVYDPTGTAGNLFVEMLPPTPGVAVALALYDDGTEPDSRLGYDEPRMQVRVRGDADSRTSRVLAKAIRDELHGLGPVTLPDGTDLILSVCLSGAPAWIGVDDTGRHEHVANFRMEIRNITTHRI